MKIEDDKGEKLMPVQVQKEMLHEGKPGISTMTFSLVSYDAMDHITKELTGRDKPSSFASMIHEAKKPYILFRSDLFPGDVEVPYEQLISEYEGVDFESVYLEINTKWSPIK
ncbi:MAG: hypothetical protein GC179_11675 [Anaerolineaceae bacterium]|nr:hypothetical protein [Anaerolineaceae bacterium]